jgi:two-component system NtrC family sensor kinase
MYRLDAFKLSDMASCSADIRQFGLESDSFEEAAEKIIRYFYSNFCTEQGDPALSLARIFKTVRFDGLDDELRRLAQQNFESVSDTRFLALMASVGELSNWNDRRSSRSHRLVPLSDTAALRANMPMIAALLREYDSYGTDPDQNGPSANAGYILEPDQKRFNVFYVPEASSCALITDQDFVKQFGIRTVLGFGGMLNSSSSFWIVMFCRVFVPKEIAQMFNPLCLSAKNALLHSSVFRPLLVRRELA